MDQLSLKITPRLSYAAENFILHEGVLKLFEEVVALVTHDNFSVAFIDGSKRSGKTHLSILLTHVISVRGFFPRLVEGSSLSRWLIGWNEEKRRSDEIIIVDEAEKYFKSKNPGRSGEFVSLVEELRKSGKGIILISGTPLTSFPCDEHIKSRILPGVGYTIGSPSEDDMRGVIGQMALQRGLKLLDRKLLYLSKRLPREVKAIEEYLDRLIKIASVTNSKTNFSAMNDALIEDKIDSTI